MADRTAIEWTDATWNPITGCSVVSPGCTNCYAMRLAGTRLQSHPSRAGLTHTTKAGPVWNGTVRLNEAWLTQPLQWGRPRKIFVCAHGDLFAEGVPDAWIDRVFAVMALAPQHTFQVLTKRAARMRAYLQSGRATPVGMEAMDITLQAHFADPRSKIGAGLKLKGDIAHLAVWPLPNVWLGVSAEDQRRADERIPDLLATPAAVRFVSAEPLLGPVDLHPYLLGFAAGHPASCVCGHGHGFTRCPNYGCVAQRCHRCECQAFRKVRGADGLHWVIAGGESGPGARPMHPQWARDIRDQCAAAGVPFHFKQWGAWASGENAGSAQDRAEDTASWWDDRWQFSRVTVRQAEVMHIDDEPDLWRVGKRAAGRLLDGVAHDGMPA